jgi:nitrilase
MGGDVYRRFCAAAVQAAPVFLDRDASISRLEQRAAKAKAAGADLIVFGESYIPAFPLWNMLYAPIDQDAFYCRLYPTYTDIVEERRLSGGNSRVVGNADAPD